MAKRTSREPQHYGQGSYEGLIASETANNACVPATLIPLITLGIPGLVIPAQWLIMGMSRLGPFGSVVMASPFPGMDPYLEDPSLWPSVHHLLISHIGTTLNSLLAPRYIATFQERVFVAGADRDIYPDVLVREGSESGTLSAAARGGASATIGDPPWLIATADDEVVETFIELRTATGDQRVVTVIEVLSPRNKAAGSEGRRLYRQKQREVLASDTHLLEIDLLRSGQHTVAAPREALLRRGPYRYLVSLSRRRQRHQCEVWGILLSSPLPRVNVPLAGNDPDIILDLQAVWRQVYAAGAFERIIDYTQSPTIAFDDDDARWADEYLRRSGHRYRILPEAQGSIPLPERDSNL